MPGPGVGLPGPDSTALRFARRADYLAGRPASADEDEDALSDVRALFGDPPAEILG